MGEYQEKNVQVAITLLSSIQDAAAATKDPTKLRNLAEAYGLVTGSVTGVSKVEVKTG